MVYCSGSNLPIKSLTIGFCPPRHIGDFAEILSTVIGNFRSAKRACLFGGWGRGKLFLEQPIFTGVPMQVKNCASVCHSGATSNLTNNTRIFGNRSETHSLVCVVRKSK